MLRLAKERGRSAEALAVERKAALEQREALLVRTQGELVEVRSALELHRAEEASRERKLTGRVAEAEAACREAEDATEQSRARLRRVESVLERVSSERGEAIRRFEESQKVLQVERNAHVRTVNRAGDFGGNSV